MSVSCWSWKRQTDIKTKQRERYFLTPLRRKRFLRQVTRPAASRSDGALMLFVELPESCSTWWWCAPLPTPRSLQIDRICLNIKISVMGEQLRADCSLLGPQAAKYEGPQMSNIQLSESICCLLVCVRACMFVYACARVCVVCAFEMSSIPPPRKALMHSEYVCLSNLGDRLLKVFPK